MKIRDMVEVNFFIGSYSTGGPYVPNAREKGIHSCIFNLKTGNIGEKHLYQDNSNSTYLCKDQEDHLFAVCDNFHEYGEVKAFRIAKDSSLELLSVQNTYGTSSCHVEYEEDSKRIFIASYANAQLSIHGFDGKRFPEEPQVLKFQGNGPNSQRQESAHIHQAIVSPDKKWVYACDLGSDKVWLLENAKEEVSVKTGMSIPAGLLQVIVEKRQTASDFFNKLNKTASFVSGWFLKNLFQIQKSEFLKAPSKVSKQNGKQSQPVIYWKFQVKGVLKKWLPILPICLFLLMKMQEQSSK